MTGHSGQLVEQTYPSGRKVKNSFEVDGGLAKVETQKAGGSWQDRAENFTYNAAGAVTSLELGNGRWESTQFNARLQPTQIALGTTQGATNVLRLDYSYSATGNNGNIHTQSIRVPGLVPPFVQTYIYDDLNRLKSATEAYSRLQTWKQTFVYDRYGNRRFDFAGGNTTFPASSCTEAICNPTISTSNNRLTSSGYSYDNSGNTTADAQGRTFVYDAENKQTSVSDTGGTIGTYSYDGDGKRVKKVSANETVVFVYNAMGQLVAEYADAISQTPKVNYLTADYLGSPRINTDQSAAVTARHDYHPFGEEIATSQRTSGLGYAADAVRKQFTGYERDDETGLDYAKARYQLSGHGRFTGADPYVIQFEMKSGEDEEEQMQILLEYISEPRNLNKYVYALNNPLKHTDPTGMRPPNGWEQKALNKLDELIAVANEAGESDLAEALTNAKNEISQIIAKLGENQKSVPVGIAVFAILNIGERKYDDDATLSADGQIYGSPQNKCNVFVAWAHRDGGGIRKGRYPTKNGKFAAANWLGDIKDRMKLKNLPVVYDQARVGDVVAWRTKGGEGSGHSGISIGGGAVVYAGGPPGGTPQVRTIAFVNDRLRPPNYEAGVIRRFNGKP